MGKSPKNAMTTSTPRPVRYKSLIGGEQYEPDEENPMIGFRGCGRYTDPFFEECFAMELEVPIDVLFPIGWLIEGLRTGPLIP